jgi:peptidoglycan/LPS O-acetylase OafA/YrhL
MQRIPQLDAIRGIAILMVIAHNQGLFANGWMGVDLFFVLSGFLITGILVETRQAPDYFRRFYARRCLRIWPLYAAALAFMFLVVPLLRPSEAHTVFDKSSPWWSYPLFLQNLLVRNPTGAAGLLAVTWSLAIEEQFYLVWPWVVRYISLKTVRRIAIVVVCLSPALRFYLSHHDVNLYTNVFCRLDGLMGGALLAILIRSKGFAPSRFVRAAWVSAAVTATLAWALEAAGARWLVYSFSAAASASFVYLALFSRRAWLRTLLTNRVLVSTGVISYGLYLLHKIPFDLLKTLHLEQRPLGVLPIGLAASYLLAAASWTFLERPILDAGKHRLDRVVRRADHPIDVVFGHDERRSEEEDVARRGMDADGRPRPGEHPALHQLGLQAGGEL